MQTITNHYVAPQCEIVEISLEDAVLITSGGNTPQPVSSTIESAGRVTITM